MYPPLVDPGKPFLCRRLNGDMARNVGFPAKAKQFAFAPVAQRIE